MWKKQYISTYFVNNNKFYEQSSVHQMPSNTICRFSIDFIIYIDYNKTARNSAEEILYMSLPT